MRITFKDLRRHVAAFNQMHGTDLTVDAAYGGYAIEHKGGSAMLSPRGSARETLVWLQAYQTGFYHGKRHVDPTDE
jgi:hypothetical protein